MLISCESCAQMHRLWVAGAKNPSQRAPEDGGKDFSHETVLSQILGLKIGGMCMLSRTWWRMPVQEKSTEPTVLPHKAWKGFPAAQGLWQGQQELIRIAPMRQQALLRVQIRIELSLWSASHIRHDRDGMSISEIISFHGRSWVK